MGKDKSWYALDYMVENYDFDTVLDIGCGTGDVAKILESDGKKVTTNDIFPIDRDWHICKDFMKAEISDMFDAIWCSHFLEHQPNVGLFLRKIRSIVREGGVICLSVPPLKNEIVGGHLNLWNGGLLLYNLVASGFDCSQARIKKKGYNISIITNVKKIELPKLKNDYGDIETLSEYFPESCKSQGFNGDITELNWSNG